MGVQSPDFEKAVESKRRESVKNWTFLLEGAGALAEDLDELVHDVASREASAVNNAGMAGQLEYLAAKLGRDTDRELRGVFLTIARENRQPTKIGTPANEPSTDSDDEGDRVE